MSGASKQRTRQERIDSLGIQKPRFVQWWNDSDKADWTIRIGIGVVAAIALLVVCQTWKPPFSHRLGSIPPRDVVTRVTFDVPNEVETESLRQEKRRQAILYYRNRPQSLDNLTAALHDDLLVVLSADSYDQMRPEEREAFKEFYLGDETQPDAGPNRFSLMKSVFVEDHPELKTLDSVLSLAMEENRRKGLLQSLQHTTDDGSQQRIRVYSTTAEEAEFVEIDEVRIAQASVQLKSRLREVFRQRFATDEDGVVAEMISDWIAKRLPEFETLRIDLEESENARVSEADSVQPVMIPYRTGESKLASAGEALSETDLALLKQEWNTLVAGMHLSDRLARMLAYAGMVAAIYLLCASYIFFVGDRRILRDRVKLAKLLGVMVLAVGLGFVASRDQWRGELVPLVLASIVLAVVHGRELALLLMAAACVSLTLFLGADLSILVTLAAACTSCILLLGRIRSRTHLLFVGLTSAAITMLTVVGVGIVTSETLSTGILGTEQEQIYQGPLFSTVVWGLINEACWAGFCIVVSSSVMTPLLPLVEKTFGVQTDLSLLELGDASHPLLRRLAQRAPGTYNHSINVASIAEAAADSIGANGLLVRVGAYFHDIGKMFKPEYFIENQTPGVNQHDSLQPAMSTLVIIAHVKDGADLARNHHLPEPIIDFILQHHGTTLVEYFYREAARRSEEDPNAEVVSDKDFRYPGPKPQTLEAAVMMLADTVESASRTLVDPTPARIQNLVDSIAQKKMGDGQFDECGLTFKQLAQIRHSLVKSLTAIYHARVKYPGQQSA